MTTSLSPAPPAPAATRPVRSAGSLMLPLAGGALVAGSLLYVAGLATSPPTESLADADYIASLAADEGQTALSALLLHYGNMALGLAWLAAPALVRGRRGRIPTIVGALLSAIGLVTVTGLVLYDFWTGGIGRELPADTALALFGSVQGSAGVAVVGTVTLLGLLGPLVGYAGLARAGVISWWLLVPAVACLVASAALTFSPLLYAGFALLGAAPAVVVGVRMLQRSRAEATVAG
ncbi:hypothetical protein JD79_00857 [Geodermatophilus normandii]|uniref:DUF4386 family protein n=1 Tax=Geodermatophilus normandii TaxID=1137989 RepID=A0A317QFJ0_9ACTN|nr:hypothetical protein [Geodermatophilus normandii]PWW21721.1 hypothetical protein JD79_00857 [Geodermatophilus normandii]